MIAADLAARRQPCLAALRRYRVYLLDRATFPHDTISRQPIQTPGVAHLAAGASSNASSTPAAPIHRAQFDVGPFAIRDLSGGLNGGSPSYAPRRTILDHLLVTAAPKPRPRYTRPSPSASCYRSKARYSACRQHASRRTCTEQARLVIGVDGWQSLVAPAVEAPLYEVRPRLSFPY